MDLRYDGLGLFYYGVSIDFALGLDNGLYPFGMSKMTHDLRGGALFVCKYVLPHILTILSVFAFLVWKAN
jgi:hypothetical protein